MHVWRLLLAVLVVVGLGAGLVYVVLTDGEIGDPVPALVTAAPSTAGPAREATVAFPTQVPSSTATPAVPERVTASIAVTSTTASAPPVVVALRDALTAWGEFAVTGRIRDLGDHFVVGGPQKRRLRAEARAIRADPAGPPPYLVTTNDILTISATPTDVVLRAEIEWAREGEPTQFFVWDIQMQLVEGMWQLLTVEEVAVTAER